MLAPPICLDVAASKSIKIYFIWRFPSILSKHLFLIFCGVYSRKKMRSLRLLVGVILISVVSAQEPGAARILAAKRILNQYLVQRKDLIVEYNLYNIGESVAYDVHLIEENFDKELFDVVSGFPKAHWDRIPPSQNVSHVIILQPKHYMSFNFTSARIQYKSGESQDASLVVGYTSAPGEGQIWEINQFNRQFAPHYADWITFLIMTIPTVGIPYLLWYRSKSRYDVSKTVLNKKL
ncbi:translocon-associated protein subunit beta-like [Paramacrobiotus metropolitanus]|uniref:translocon-associated protein subunit beta-like n=1 Tax=Paramacrobiotus metropolitanus TaxID=2943436 RepID=UPI0024456AB3|nr:translocon-associated protein subunit beta-like [Paramacrobiotus metropolitanus]